MLHTSCRSVYTLLALIPLYRPVFFPCWRKRWNFCCLCWQNCYMYTELVRDNIALRGSPDPTCKTRIKRMYDRQILLSQNDADVYQTCSLLLSLKAKRCFVVPALSCDFYKIMVSHCYFNSYSVLIHTDYIIKYN